MKSKPVFYGTINSTPKTSFIQRKPEMLYQAIWWCGHFLQNSNASCGEYRLWNKDVPSILIIKGSEKKSEKMIITTNNDYFFLNDLFVFKYLSFLFSNNFISQFVVASISHVQYVHLQKNLFMAMNKLVNEKH